MEQEIELDPRAYFTFVCGEVVRVRRVSERFITKVGVAARKKWIEANGPLPPCPTYTRELAGGETMTFEHNETTIVEPEFKADLELQEQWQEHRYLRTLLNHSVFEQTAQAQVLRGVVDDPSEEWLAEQAHFDITPPEDERERKWEWIVDLAVDWREIFRLLRAIGSAPDRVEEEAAATLESFRDSVGRT